MKRIQKRLCSLLVAAIIGVTSLGLPEAGVAAETAESQTKTVYDTQETADDTSAEESVDVSKASVCAANVAAADTTSDTAAAGSWGTADDGRKYYLYSDGTYAHGVVKIGSKVYAFSGTSASDTSKPGYLRTAEKARVCTIEGKKYYVNKNGVCLKKGWHYNSYIDEDTEERVYRLYYFAGENNSSVAGKTVTDKSWGKITMKSNGLAKMDATAKAKVQAMRTLKKIVGNKDLTKKQQLNLAWKYMTTPGKYSSKTRWYYAAIYPKKLSSKYFRLLAADMLENKAGNCYGFACAFAALAREIGYTDVKIVCTRVRGSRDGASDGYTQHAFVKINGKYYDPEGKWAGFVTAKAVTKYPMKTKKKKLKKF